MIDDKIALGIDTGSAAVSVVILSKGPLGLKVLRSGYAFHLGKPAELVRAMLADAEAAGIPVVDAVRCTSQVSPRVRGTRVDSRTAFLEAARAEVPGVKTLLVVGAEKFTRMTLGADGTAPVIRGNSSCAAGTGSFLDQQAKRLGLAGSAELASLALANAGSFPAIASRCSVFAKTDLIHAQAEGWTREEICDGLCAGLARNIADTLFPGEVLPGPVFMAGGVSRNAAVVRRLSELCGSPVAVSPDSHLFGALGAACRALEDVSGVRIRLDTLIEPEERTLSYEHGPLSIAGLEYPEFGGIDSFVFVAAKNGKANPVETDVYERLEGPDGVIAAWLGIDVGSTSTKAALVAEDGTPLAGFYTRTAGRPVEAAQSVLEAAREVERRHGVRFGVRGAATTGSGRKIVKSVVGADAAIDEISAHARAAVELDPGVDTIIEIGGQDSKFTTVRNGIVVYAQMNTVCAAGTGSFIEEQADRLGVPLSEYSERALRAKAPLTSDRCTVFMERDLNHLQASGYGVDELLAAALFSVCDNYLGKVAQEGLVGNRICFQGATARNKALVAAFASRLGRKVSVSKFCHLTGAVGAALVARDDRVRPGAPFAATAFKGFGICDDDIASRGENCALCANRCRLRILTVRDEEIAFGFLCGRDWGTKRFVARPKLAWDLLPARRALEQRMFGAPGQAAKAGHPRPAKPSPVAENSRIAPRHGPAGAVEARTRIRIGLPRALYLHDEAEGWSGFFRSLGFTVVRVGDDPGEASGIMKEGKRLSGAEYCAPMAYAYGEVASLLKSSDFVFLPVYLERARSRIRMPETKRKGIGKRMFCNYSQFATVTIPHAMPEGRRILTPLVEGHRRSAAAVLRAIAGELDRASRVIPFPVPAMNELASAWKRREAGRAKLREGLRESFAEELARTDGPVAVLVGRPYDVLAPEMNKGIPDMIAAFGLPAFFQDMLPILSRGESSDDLTRLRGEFHWDYAVRVLEAAAWCARNPRAYPVFVTCFKCSPDSFALVWFKKILDAAGKPYLILQIDEHDSGVGYETRIEAGVRAFRNHYAKSRNAFPGQAADGTAPALASGLAGKTVLFPNWDPLVAPLFAAAIRRVGLDARVLEETPEAIRRSMTHNSGQCIPISIIAQEAMDYVRGHGLDPASTVLWMMDVQWPCNIPLYPRFIKAIFDTAGGGMERLNVYRGELTCLDISPNAMVGAYLSFTLGGSLRQLGCRVRPYEKVEGATDRATAETMADLVATFESGGKRGPALRRMIDRFEAIPTGGERRPRVAIFGDFYSRDNEIFNQGLIRMIERCGGEVITATYVDYAKATADTNFKRLWAESRYYDAAAIKASVATARAIDRAFFLSSGERRLERTGWRTRDIEKKLEAFGVKPEHEGECFDNLFKVARIVEEYPDVALFVQANPAFCCPSIITESMRSTLERVTGVPVVPITYDGTGESKNDMLATYLDLARRRAGR
ncbi:MAG: acyl-CoA dehydratase activase [Spirochaetes bacterium]|nr:acyl-CoA dehydratase activase [Spirochaetota bacterium]